MNSTKAQEVADMLADVLTGKAIPGNAIVWLVVAVPDEKDEVALVTGKSAFEICVKVQGGTQFKNKTKLLSVLLAAGEAEIS